MPAASQFERPGGSYWVRLAAPGAEVVDTKELAERQEQQQLRDAEQQRDADELQAVLDALQRLDQGSYGRCADCGEAIAVERLYAQPSAKRCTACQANEESPHGRALAA